LRPIAPSVCPGTGASDHDTAAGAAPPRPATWQIGNFERAEITHIDMESVAGREPVTDTGAVTAWHGDC
jgi:hypothetical protein